MNVITHTFVGLKCLTETKIQILCYNVNHTHFHIVEMGCQTVQLLSAHIVGHLVRQFDPSLKIVHHEKFEAIPQMTRGENPHESAHRLSRISVNTN